MSDSREDLIYKAKVCEQTERYEAMLEYMNKVLAFDQEISAEERNLLSVAYKNSVSSKRTSWRITENLEKKESQKTQNDEQQMHMSLLKKFKAKIEGELDKSCNEIIK